MDNQQYNHDYTVRPLRRKKFPLNPQIMFPVITLVLMVAAFFGGVAYQKGKTTSASTASANGQFGSGQNGMMGGPGGFDQGNRAIGTVSSISDSSITITTRGSSSATYTITSSTTVTDDGDTASVSDIQTGDTVMLELDDSDSTTVTSIALNPSFGGGPMGSSSSSSSATTDSTQSI